MMSIDEEWPICATPPPPPLREKAILILISTSVHFPLVHIVLCVKLIVP